MEDFEQWPLGLNPYANDPAGWGPSLLTNAEPILAALETSGAESAIEIGAYAGDFTHLLLLWGGPRGMKVTAVDPSPQPELEQLADEHAELELIREPSLTALERIPLADAIVLDGDHNYYTVTEELRRIAERSHSERQHLPLILLHDVCWPHGRRDDYYDPDQIPPEYRQPVVEGGGLYPGVTGVYTGALPYKWPAAEEGGPRNGVLTAVEDFIEAHEERLRLAVVPTFYGLGLLWEERAPYSDRLARQLEPWHESPHLARLERNRVLHLASAHVQQHRAHVAEDQLHRAHALLDRMLHSRAFAVAELFLKLRQRGRPAFSREQIRELLNRSARSN
ncbi:MAG TPA: class I SAM-dependent methyltransferase [Solirubrobacteraceae bacterium]|nr:class I SAM-dependent methyltransferase [Solirubrobacteraceae bacterium]